MTRSFLEGVAFGLKDIFRLTQAAGLGEVEQVLASGGGTRSPLWRQILASVLETELVTVNTTEGAAIGAALLAGVGAEAWSDVDAACLGVVKITGSQRPEAAQAERYQDQYRVYQGLYPALRDSFKKM